VIPVDSLLLAVGLLLVTVASAILHALVKRFSERVAAWFLPEDQSLSFRFAWIVVRLAEVLAPKTRHRWIGVWEDSGFVTGPVNWAGAHEARADLETSLCAGQRVAEPVKLVLPLLAEAIKLRFEVERERVVASVKGNGFLIFLLILLSAGAAIKWVGEFPRRFRGNR
jgi:hypothetical protein